MRLAQISDIHFANMSWNPFALCSKRIAGVCNWLLNRRSHQDHRTLESLPSLFKSLKIDWLLFAGDATTTSLPSEYAMAKNFFHRIKCPTLYIPGNHDHYTQGAHREKRFYRHFRNGRKEVAHPVEFFTLKDHGVEAHLLGPSWWCVALDTAPAMPLTSSNGLFSTEQELYLEEVLALLPTESIALLNHFPFFQNDAPQHHLLRADALRALIEKHPRIRLYLQGHTHRHTIADLQPNGLPLILDGGCPIEKDGGTWNLIDVDDVGCTVQPYRWSGEAWQGEDKRRFTWSRGERSVV